jgi:hypothetical protein
MGKKSPPKNARKKKPEPIQDPPQVEVSAAMPPPPEHDHHDHLVSHRLIDTIVRQYALNYMDRHPGCQINVCQMAVECCLREDFGCCEDALACVLDSLEWQLPVLHMMRGGSSV